MEVAVHADGRVTADGREATLEALQQSLSELKRNHGSVLYYREGANYGHGGAGSKAHPKAVLFVRAIFDAHVPVSVSSKPDFSDVVLPDGTTKPR
jgi:hypothetical protein